MKKQKKAMMMEVIVAIVVMLLIIVVLIPLPKWISGASEKGALSFACRKSLEIVDNLRMVGGSLADGFGNVMKIDCATEYIESSNKKEELTQEVADHLYDCWSLYGDKENLFDQSTGTYCVICRVFEFYRADKIEGLIDYLRDKKAPTIRGGTYLQNFGGGAVLAEGAEAKYNFYPVEKGKKVALIVTFGTSGFHQQQLIFDKDKGIGMFLYDDYDNIGNIGCYSFEGRTASLEYKR